MTTTRFPNGVTNVGEDSMFGELGQLVPVPYHTFFDDFDDCIVATNGWVSTADALVLLTGTSGNNGIVQLTAGSFSPGSGGIHKEGQSFTVGDGKKLWMQIRASVDTITDGAALVGLASSSAIGPGIYFNNLEPLLFGPEATIRFVSDDGNTVETVPLGQIAPNDLFVVGVMIDGNGVCSLYFNGNYVGQYSGTLPAGGLCPILYAVAIMATTSISVDYILVVKER